MQKYEFVKFVDDRRSILRGRWKSVAKKAGLDYHVIRNYINGSAPDEDVRIKISEAILSEVEDIKTLISETEA